MDRKTEEFHTVDFFRKIRDEQAAVLAGKSPAEIIAFFSPKPESTERSGAKRQPAVQS